MASGFLNGTSSTGGPSVGGHSCADLVVGSPADYGDTVGWNTGAIYTYYGSPNGLQVVNPYAINAVTCNTPGSYVCGTGKYYPPSTDFTPRAATMATTLAAWVRRSPSGTSTATASTTSPWEP